MSELAGKKILIVDDEEMLREVLRERLELAGAMVSEADNGKDAYDLTLKNKFDVILSDIRMPGGDGVELLNKVRETSQKLPIMVLVTAFSDIAPADAFDKGASAIITKPFKLDFVMEALQFLLKKPHQKWTRKHERIASEFQIRYQYTSFNEARRSNALNIGQGGLFIRCEKPLPAVGECIDFSIKFEHGEPSLIEGKAIVRWNRQSPEEHSGIGVEFIGLNEPTQSSLQKLLRATKTKAFIPKQ